MSAPERPPPPIVGKVTHHNIELYWEEALSECNKKAAAAGDPRARVCVQEQDKSGGWGNVYTGYAKRHTQEGLETWTQYKYRIRFMNPHGNSEWSALTTVSTTKEPLTGEHIHRCLLLQDLRAMEKVLESGDVNVDTPNKYGNTPLMIASEKGHIDFLESLLEHGGDVNYQNDAGKTPLMLASYAGRTQAVKELRHHGAQYELRDRGGSTALHWAMDGANLELIDWMLEDGADHTCKDYNGWTPLLRVAAVGGNKDVAHLLIRSKADVNLRDKDGKTALMIAVVNGHYDLVTLLLENGADLSLKNEFGKTAYEMSLAMERRRVVKSLEAHMEKNGIKYHH